MASPYPLLRDPAMEAELEALHGKAVKLREYRGSSLLLPADEALEILLSQAAGIVQTLPNTPVDDVELRKPFAKHESQVDGD